MLGKGKVVMLLF